MNAKKSTSILDHFADLPDFRVERSRQHELLDVVVIAICAVIANAESWEDVAAFGKAKQQWLRTFLRLPNGIPSHDTFCRVFRHLAPDAFQRCLIGWLQAVAESLGLQGVTVEGLAQQRRHCAVDGKTLRRSIDRAGAKSALHLVSAWATQTELTLGQVAVDAKSNEITAIPKLLQLLDLKGALVTIDAIGCQKEIVADVVAGGADYVIAVKDNQPRHFEDVKKCFSGVAQGKPLGPGHSVECTEETGHGRQELREVHTIANPEGIRDKGLWAGLVTACLVISIRTIGETVSAEVRYYIGSLDAGAKEYAAIIRDHWRIENSLHWVLDVTFREDYNRTRKDHGPENLALLRRLAVSLLKNEKTRQASTRSKRYHCSLDENYLLTVLAGAVSPVE
jgi:predicted transposase YbfD/YdcC